MKNLKASDLKKSQQSQTPKALKRCIVDGCRMNQMTQHNGKNTFKSLVGVEIQELFSLKEDDSYIDEVISKKINLNNFYGVEDGEEMFWVDFTGKHPMGVIEERLLRNYAPVELVCGYHQFLFLKHKEMISGMKQKRNFEKSRSEQAQRQILVQYRRFVQRFWNDFFVKFYRDLTLINDLISVIFDTEVIQLEGQQLLIAQECLEIVKLLSPNHKLNSCLNYFGRDKSSRDSITSSYKDCCLNILNFVVKKLYTKLPEIVTNPTAQKKTCWIHLAKILMDFSNETCTDIIENSECYFKHCESCLTEVFMNGNFHRDSVESNDLIFYALSIVTTGLFCDQSRSLRHVYEQSKSTLFDLFLGRYQKWSRSVFEAFCVLLHMHDGDAMAVGYMRLPKYRVMKEYSEKRISELLGHEAGGPWKQDDFLDVIDKIESMRHIANSDVQAMIENYSQSGNTIY